MKFFSDLVSFHLHEINLTRKILQINKKNHCFKTHNFSESYYIASILRCFFFCYRDVTVVKLSDYFGKFAVAKMSYKKLSRCSNIISKNYEDLCAPPPMKNEAPLKEMVSRKKFNCRKLSLISVFDF